MEIPSTGRAVVEDTFAGLQITIPSKKNWFLILFLGVWLCGWTMGETFAIGGITGTLGHFGGASAFLGVWLIAWTVGGAFAFRTFFWNLAGKEIITVGQGELSIAKKGALFVSPKTYDLNEAKNFRTQEDDSNNFWSGRRNNTLSLDSGGTIRFDYGMKTIKFAGGIDEAEAAFLLEKLKDKKILTDKNFNN